MGTRVVFEFAGKEPADINRRTMRPGQILLEGVVPDGLMVADVHLALRHGLFLLRDMGAERQRGKPRADRAGAAVSGEAKQ